MGAISPGIIGMILIATAAQVLAVFLLPMSRGLTQLLPTIVMAVAFLFALGIMARLVNAGVNLSLLIPVQAALVPLASIAISILVYGEAASLAKVGMLVFACVLIGAANAV